MELKNSNKNQYSADTSRKIIRIFFLLLIGAGCIAGFFFFINGEKETKADLTPPVKLPPAVIDAGVFQLDAEWRQSLVESRDEVKQKDTFGHVLDRMGIPPHITHEIVKALEGVMDLTKVRPGAKISVLREKGDGPPIRLEYARTGRPRLVVLKTPTGYAASWKKYCTVNCLAASEGAIKNSLWGSAVQLYNLDPELVMKFADVFAYDVDFFTDIQKGDVFRLLYEDSYSQGNKLGSGKILAAEFINNGRKLEAYYYEDDQGVGAYYDSKGGSLKKMFLKSPLAYRRISSHFSRSRLHPILKIRRPHLGVDYSAPTGTPVEALGDGVVTFAGWKGGYGNFIVIKHNKSYITQYGHLHGFAKGIKKGVRVKQGQLIGYVGSTGLSTGPHLDFRVKENGKFIDPLSVKLQPAPPIKEKDKADFLAMVEQNKAEMAGLLSAER